MSILSLQKCPILNLGLFVSMHSGKLRDLDTKARNFILNVSLLNNRIRGFNHEQVLTLISPTPE